MFPPGYTLRDEPGMKMTTMRQQAP